MPIVDSKINPIIINENITSEKIINYIDDKVIGIKSLLSDTYRKWYAIKNIKCSKEEKKAFDEVIAKGKTCCDDLMEIIDTGKDVSYETTYNEFLKSVSDFYDSSDSDKEKTESIDLSYISSITKYFNIILDKVKSKAKDIHRKFVNAIYIIINRTMNIINKLQYNYSNIFNKANKKDFNSGIINKRYGENNISVNINDVNQTDVNELLEKLRTTNSYPTYKKLFDSICELYGKKDVGAIKLLDLEKQNKVVFISFGKLKPMVIKAGTPLYHISPSATIKRLEPRFKSKDNITFYSSQRIYFTDKFSDPKTILKEVENPQIYRHILKEDIIAYRDAEYGSWYHNCIYTETNKTFPVENITAEVMDEVSDKVESKENIDITEESKKDNYDKLVKSINEKEKDIDNKLEKKDLSKKDINEIQNSMNDLYSQYDKLTDDDKVKHNSNLASLFNKVANKTSKFTGLERYNKNKKLLGAIRFNVPMSRDTYWNIKKQLFDNY